MLKKLRKNKKGFTLAELLIVVAIIGVLVAISIPIFTSQLEKSRDAVTLSNIRAAYAEAQSSYLTEDTTSADAKYTKKEDGTATVVVTGVEAKGQSGTIANYEQLPFATVNGMTTVVDADHMGGKAGTYNLTFSYDANGNITKVECEKTDK